MNDDEVFESDFEIVDVELPTVDGISKIQWRTAEGKLVYIKDMPDSHLRNCCLFLMGLGYLKCIAPEHKRVIWLRIFRMEWDRRMIARAAGNRVMKAEIRESHLKLRS